MQRTRVDPEPNRTTSQNYLTTLIKQLQNFTAITFDFQFPQVPIDIDSRRDSRSIGTLHQNPPIMAANGITTRISELSSIILSNTSKYDNYLSTQGLPTPSFDPGAPPFLPLPSEMAEAKQLILEATDELHALIAGPLGTLFTPYVSSTLTSISSPGLVW